jgi:hypothetical protein
MDRFLMRMGFNEANIYYEYFEGNFEKLPDFTKLEPVQTGIADSTFNPKALSLKSGSFSFEKPVL